MTRIVWIPDLSSIEHDADWFVAKLAVFASAGEQAIRMLGRPPHTEILRRELALQGLVSLVRLPAPDCCTTVLTAIAEGRRPTRNTRLVAGIMRQMAEAISTELGRRSREYDRMRGVRRCF